MAKPAAQKGKGGKGKEGKGKEGKGKDGKDGKGKNDKQTKKHKQPRDKGKGTGKMDSQFALWQRYSGGRERMVREAAVVLEFLCFRFPLKLILKVYWHDSEQFS